MGIPKFASWITKKYPDIVVKTAPSRVHGLYIDMNGIIHPCCHSEDDPSVATRTVREKMEQVCLCVEQLVEVTRPTTVLYLAMDGVAPRAKMNQQRSRRYMAAAAKYGAMFAPAEHGFTKEQRQAAKKDLQEARKSLDLGSGLYSTAAAELFGATKQTEVSSSSVTGQSKLNASGMGPSQGSEDFLSRMLPSASFEILDELHDASATHGKHRAQDAQPHRREDIDSDEAFDSNCISPGTVFMAQMSTVLRDFVAAKLAAAVPGSPWYQLCVVLSDSNSPGEGEHKLIDFLRSQSSVGSSAGSLFHRGGVAQGGGAHVICGLDADLILLCLALHLPDVWIMRDVKRQSTFKPSSGSAAAAPNKKSASAARGGEEGDEDVQEPIEGGDTNAVSSKPSGGATPSKPKYEYFQVDTIGNSIVSEVYALSQVTGFSDCSDLKEPIVSGSYRFFSYSKDGTQYAPSAVPPRARPSNPCTESYNSKIIDDFVCLASIMGNDFLPRIPSAFCGESAMDNILEVYTRRVLPFGFLTVGNDIHLGRLCRFFAAFSEVETMMFRQHAIKTGKIAPEDAAGPVGSRVDQQTWRKVYYDTTTCTREKLDTACRAYIEGMRFVWRYYSSTSEFCSWSWGYPLHHAPFCSDIVSYLDQRMCDPKQLPAPALEKDPPSPFTQLLCILPPTSGPLVPKCLEDVMWKPPPGLEDTFPVQWAVDYSGADEKEHLATVLLPFANLEQLRQVVRDKNASYSAEEELRNQNAAVHQVLARQDVRRDRWHPTEALYGLRSEGELPGFDGLVWCASLADCTPAQVRPKTYSPSLIIRGFVVGSADTSLYVTAKSMVSRTRRGAAAARGGGSGTNSKQRPSSIDSGAEARAQRGPSLGEFFIALLAFVVLSHALIFKCALFPSTESISTANNGDTECFLTTLVRDLVFQPFLFYGISGLFLFALCGTLTNTPLPAGANLHRNPIRDAHVDWLCPQCCQLNFMRNERCFGCRLPFDTATASAVYTGKLSHQPPLFDPNHAAYVQLTELKLADVVGMDHADTDEHHDIDMM